MKDVKGTADGRRMSLSRSLSGASQAGATAVSGAE